MRPLIIMNGEKIDWFHTVIRMLMYLAGVAVLALGMSLQTASGLGVAALTCFATTLSMLTGKTLGFWITATYVAYIVAQLAILRSEFQPRILLELFFSTLIGGLTDLFMAVNPLHPTALPTQIATMLLSLAVTAFGVSLVVNMGVVPNAPDGFRDLDISGQWPLWGNLYGVARYNRNLRDHRLTQGIAGIEYNAGCWVFRGVVQQLVTTSTDVNRSFFSMTIFTSSGVPMCVVLARIVSRLSTMQFSITVLSPIYTSFKMIEFLMIQLFPI